MSTTMTRRRTPQSLASCRCDRCRRRRDGCGCGQITIGLSPMTSATTPTAAC